MQYRKFGRLDWKVSALGFGAMRLPVVQGNRAAVEEPEAISMIRYAIDHGVNYVDTAYFYHDGQSERVVGKALRDGYREKVKLATKLPVRIIESAQDFDRYFNEQFERLQTDKFDFYLLHGLDAVNWPKMRDMGVLRWLEKQMARGRFDYLGFSFHDTYDTFKGIVDAYDNWTFCQVLYNYMDVAYQAGRRGVEYAAGKGLGLVVMEPLRGGQLSQEPPPQIAKIFESDKQKRRPVEWSLLWVWNQPEISVALSGMSKMEQVVENVAIAERSGPGKLTAGELALFDELRDAYEELKAIPCTSCGYCMPCTSGVEIPAIFKIYNEAMVNNDLPRARLRYRGMSGLRAEQRADQCVECGECTDACPQHLPTTDWLKKVHELLGPK